MNQSPVWVSVGIAVASIVGCGDGGDAARTPGGSAAGASGAGAGVSPSAGNAGTSGSSFGGTQSAQGGSANLAGRTAGGAAPGSGGEAPGGATSGGASGAAGSGGETAQGGGGVANGGAAAGGGAAGAGGTGAQDRDVFGIPMLQPSRTPGLLWTSEHWSTGSARALNGRDPSDPTGWSIRRGDTSNMAVDGQGVLSMGGPQPRFYIMPKAGEKQPFFLNIEFTGYYRRTADDGAFNAGFVVGMRSHPEGHGSDTCNTTTYYLAFRNSGTYLFDKELNHPNDSPGKGGQLFSPSHAIPVGKWIGMKYLVYNLPGNKAVKLETYVDENSNGNGTKPSDWKKVGETVDDGNWTAPTGNCDFPANMVVTEGGGVVFIRNTDVGKVEYTKLSWREIEPPQL